MSLLPSFLLADDDDDDIYFAQRAFKTAEIKNPLYIAHDGQEVIDILSGAGKYSDRSQYPLPCLIVLDLKMPRKSGMDVLQWRSEQPVLDCIPTMVLSSSAHRYDVERAYRLGANAFVVKPASVQARAAFARSIKEFWLEFNHAPLACTEGFEEALRLHREIEPPTNFL